MSRILDRMEMGFCYDSSIKRERQRRNVEMKNLKKILSLALVGTMAVSVLAGCGERRMTAAAKRKNREL